MFIEKGVSINFNKQYKSHKFLFGEDQSRYIVTVNKAKSKEFQKNIKNTEIQFTKLGRIIQGNRVKFADNTFIDIDELKKQNKL